MFTIDIAQSGHRLAIVSRFSRELIMTDATFFEHLDLNRGDFSRAGKSEPTIVNKSVPWKAPAEIIRSLYNCRLDINLPFFFLFLLARNSCERGRVISARNFHFAFHGAPSTRRG